MGTPPVDKAASLYPDPVTNLQLHLLLLDPTPKLPRVNIRSGVVYTDGKVNLPSDSLTPNRTGLELGRHPNNYIVSQLIH